ncbi:Candidapepsin-8 [Candida viswanathii]|uniref:candidapepsin n=1 Tax=Candida viswanathii TaxID=5486 RepID=A0A367XSC8_9ASCO|nr:Candidapepsin-8 [Candida viswanathii]
MPTSTSSNVRNYNQNQPPMKFTLPLLAIAVPLVSATPVNTTDTDDDTSGVIALDFDIHQAATNEKRGLYRAQELDNQQIYYTADIYVGSNRQRQTVLVDTGSSDLWVVDAASCDSSSAECQEYGTYNAQTSHSSVNLTTAFSIEYFDGTTAAGNWFLDKVSIAGATLKKQQFADVHSNTAGNGVLGLGFKGNEVAEQQYDNVPITLKKQGFIKKSAYSLYLNSVSADKGSILFGGIDHAKYTGELIAQQIYVANYLALLVGSVKVNDVLYDAQQPALLDSGTSWTYLPQEYADAIAEKFNATWLDDEEYYSVGCDSVPGNVTYTFAAGATITVPFDDLLFHDTETECYLGIGRAAYFILGDTFLRRAYTVFNLDDETISLAQINYTNKSKIRAIR